MSKDKRAVRNRIILIAVAVLILVAVWGTINSRRHRPDRRRNLDSAAPGHIHDELDRYDREHSPTVVAKTSDPVASERPGGVTLDEILSSKERRTWQPAFTSWYGRRVDNFDVRDIHGKHHRLRDYRGKDVLVVFWATWCPPCIEEIPHLVALRNVMDEGRLAILAVSNESPALLRGFVGRAKINYTVASANIQTLPAPFRLIKGIPVSFFVDKEGRIKLAAEGMLLLGDTRAILQAR